MTRDNTDRLILPEAAATKRPAHASLGEWNGGNFDFASPRDEREWHAQAYRQSVRPDRWQAEPPVDQHTQSMLDGMPHLGAGQYFRGPDGKHRRITTEQRESPEVQAVRQQAFSDYAKTGVTWSDLAAYDDSRPHPGEDKAISLTQAKAATGHATQMPASPNKKQDIGALPKSDPTLTRMADDLALGLGKLKDSWTDGSSIDTPPPILVASDQKAAVVPGWLKGAPEPQFAPPGRPAPSPARRRDFVEGLVGHPANDNTKPAANSNVAAVPLASPKAPAARQPTITAKPNTSGVSAEDASDAEYMNRLFNWQRQGKPAPAPKEYAIHVVSDPDRFSYLEDMKDEWSRLVENHPEEIFNSMVGEVEKLSNAAQQDFFTAHHRIPNAQELAEINDATEKVVFAPADHWTHTGEKPNERVEEAKPFLGTIEPLEIPGSELSIAFSQAAAMIAKGEVEKFGGRPGSKETRRIIARVVKKIGQSDRSLWRKSDDPTLRVAREIHPQCTWPD